MSEMSRDELLAVVRRVWTEHDPVPEGLVERMQAVVASEQSADFDLDYELLVLIERSHELSGTRGGGSGAGADGGPGAPYTLQYAHGDLALLVRVAAEEQPGDGGRLDGWLAPPAAMSVRALLVGDDHEWNTEVDTRGRFEFRGLPSGLYRLALTPHENGARPFATPAFEL